MHHVRTPPVSVRTGLSPRHALAPLLTALALVLCSIAPVAGSSEAGSLPTLARAEAAANRASALDDRLQQAGFTGAALVAQGDTVLLRAGYGLANAEHAVPNTTDTKFVLGSVTKPLTAMAVLARLALSS